MKMFIPFDIHYRRCSSCMAFVFIHANNCNQLIEPEKIHTIQHASHMGTSKPNAKQILPLQFYLMPLTRVMKSNDIDCRGSWVYKCILTHRTAAVFPIELYSACTLLVTTNDCRIPEAGTQKSRALNVTGFNVHWLDLKGILLKANSTNRQWTRRVRQE